MTDIRLWNTRTKRKEALEPVEPGRVGMYVCGPTVYDRAHLGNARPVVVFDVLFRLLRHVYGDGNVSYVRNFTDVDDKINAKAAETGRPINEITDETIGWFHQDMDALGALRPTHEPRATEWIPAMVAMIERLIAEDHAYAAEGHILFRVRSYASYGALSGRSVDDMIAGSRVEVAPYKEDPLDFVLWKPSDAIQPGWDSPWGRGRPGWHIECSAMARELLGGAFDIHGGGIDLQFPHHENEIAQSACAHPDEAFARIWMHNEMLLVEGKKMSKSLGNFFTVRELLEKGVQGEVIRFVLLGTHYSKPMDWTEEKAAQANNTLQEWYFTLAQHYLSPGLIDVFEDAGLWTPDPQVVDALADDLNTHQAITRIHQIAQPRTRAEVAAFSASVNLLGLVPDWAVLGDLARLGIGQSSNHDSASQQKVIDLMFQRTEARARRDFETADRIRDLLVSAGVIITDGMAQGWTAGPDFDPVKLENLH